MVAYREALKEITREHRPQNWAGLQRNLGSVLQSLSERERNPLYLTEAINAFEAAHGLYQKSGSAQQDAQHIEETLQLLRQRTAQVQR